jgi:peptidoglycan/LPS O-acetylase OafA/YrhL
MDTAAMVAALAIGLFAIGVGIDAMNRPKATWFPTVPAVIFGTVALAAAYGDLRMIRAGGLRGARRIARHLWRMCFGLFVATGSFFLGQAKIFPEELRVVPALSAPVLLVLLAMAYWWVKIRVWPPRWISPTLSGER